LIEYDVDEGEVCVGGREIGEMPLGEYRDGMSIIPQGE
jgi:ABC-type multidrug transport system fused ATPase/permease subunit